MKFCAQDVAFDEYCAVDDEVVTSEIIIDEGIVNLAVNKEN